LRVDVILPPELSPSAITELGLLAERCGVGAVWASNYPSSRDPFISLCPLATASRTIRLGPLVITPYELHPYKIAKALAGLNELCGGRANILVGGPTGLMGTMGIDPKRMVRHVRECVEILKAASPDRTLNYQGQLFQVWGYRPEWATDPPPVVYVGANKVQMLRMAASLADGIMFGDMTEQSLSAGLQTIDGALAAAGKSRADLRLSGLVAWHVKDDEQEATREARQQLALRGMLDRAFLAPFLSEEECRLVEANRGAFFSAYKKRTHVIEGVPESIVAKIVAELTCTGSARDIDRHVERLRAFRQLGLTEVALKLHGDPGAAIRLIGERVVPALR
jgi:alkanesulfonate monooxygenase SsuD/methylene tetrahydromethanopterin reductase-like flavin-dependent oxidoreductase (luciferase family)